MRAMWSILFIIFIGSLVFLWLWGIPSPSTEVVKQIPNDVLLKI